MKSDQLDRVLPRLEELGALLSEQDAMQDRARFLSLMQEYNRLLPVGEALRRLDGLRREYEEAASLEKDADFAEMAAQEKRRIAEETAGAERALQALLQGEEGDGRSAIVEIRSGAGGEEAALFAAMLLRMYLRYAEKRGWKTELLELMDTEMGGAKEAVLSVQGRDALDRLETESGVHRIQRIPVTESNGKRQTSTATVAVLPEASEVDVVIDPGDLRIDVFRASGHGGQYINKTDSAVRITHLPTGIVATCQDEQSPLRTMEKAMQELGFRPELGDAVAKNLGSPKAMERMTAYLRNVKPRSEELVVDEMLAICSEIAAWREKKASQEANARYNEMLYYGLGNDECDEEG